MKSTVKGTPALEKRRAKTFLDARAGIVPGDHEVARG
jgi:hypothetical protein